MHLKNFLFILYTLVWACVICKQWYLMPSSTLFSCFLIYKNRNWSSSLKVLWFDEFTTKLIGIILSTLVCSTLFTEVFQFGIYLDIHVTKHFPLGSSVRPSVKTRWKPYRQTSLFCHDTDQYVLNMLEIQYCQEDLLEVYIIEPHSKKLWSSGLQWGLGYIFLSGSPESLPHIQIDLVVCTIFSSKCLMVFSRCQYFKCCRVLQTY